MTGDGHASVAVLRADDDRFQVRGRLEILALLRGLIAQHALVTAHGRGAFFVTALLAIDDDRLTFDYGVDAAQTETLLRQASLVFVTQLDHVRIQFTGRDPARIDYEDVPAFTVPVPESVTRLQRREHYRLRVPRGRPLACEVALPPMTGDALPRRVALPVHDLSCGGLALIGWPDGHRPRPGMELDAASLVLPGLGAIACRLHVVHVQGAHGAGPGAGRFGCRFVGLAGGEAALIQRYINRVERERRAML